MDQFVKNISDLSLTDKVEFFSWQEELCKGFVYHNVFNQDSSVYFGNCCRVCNSYMRNYLVNIDFIDVMNFIESFMVKFFYKKEFLLLEKKYKR